MNTNTQPIQPTVWGVFVGEHGDQLAAFNNKNGQFPPEPGFIGYVAIGWAAMGDMGQYKSRRDDFEQQFSINYYDDTRKANMVWNFAFEIKDGDFIISPSSTSGYLLVGNVVGEYEGDYNNWISVAETKTRADLMHLRRVKWTHVIPASDHRYQKLHRIGRQTVCQPKKTVAYLLNVSNS